MLVFVFLIETLVPTLILKTTLDFVKWTVSIGVIVLASTLI